MSINNGKISGVLSSFSYSCLSGTKRDPTITKEVLEDHNAGDDAGSWSNRLFPANACGKVTTFSRLRKHLGQVRSYHYSRTFLYEDAIWRILPEKAVESYKQFVEVDGKQRALELLNEFIEDLPNLIDLARLGRGSAFKESDYPSPEEIRDTFKYGVSYRPIPNTAGLNPQLFQGAIDEINAKHMESLHQSNLALVERFMAPFRTLQDQLADPKGRKIAPILESIVEITDLVPTLDLSGNTELVATAQQMHQLFSELKPELLKKDAEMQKLLGTTCTNVLSSLERFGAAGKRAFA